MKTTIEAMKQMVTAINKQPYTMDKEVCQAVSQLKEAIAEEEAQGVGLVMTQKEMRVMGSGALIWIDLERLHPSWVSETGRTRQLFTRPAPPPADHIGDATKLVGERAALVGRLRGLVDAARLRGPGCTPCLTCDDVDGISDMLAADAQQSAQLTEAVDANARLLVRMEGLKRAQQVEVPQGWKTMPTEPTKAMWKAAGDAVVALQQTSTLHHDKISDAVYRAMLAAAPQSPQGEKP